MEIINWATFEVLLKFVFYLSFSVILANIGMYLMHQGYRQYVSLYRQHIFWAGLLGIAALSLGFFVQVGTFSEQGLKGMFDPMFRQILWNSSIGDIWIIRVPTLVLLLIITWINKKYFSDSFKLTSLKLALVLFAGSSFALIGHTADTSLSIKLSLIMHALIGIWWIGSLVALWLACIYFPVEKIHLLMHRFGNVASLLVATLLVTGVFISYHLVSSFSALFTTAHGQMLLLKFSFVAGLLLLAGYHKFRLVPQLQKSLDPRPLKKSIKIEMILGMILLLITAIFSTVTGPVH